MNSSWAPSVISMKSEARDDALDSLEEVLLVQLHHVRGQPAGPQVAAGGAICSRNSGTSGMSRSDICFFSILVVMAVTPGMPARPWGIDTAKDAGGCIAVLPR